MSCFGAGSGGFKSSGRTSFSVELDCPGTGVDMAVSSLPTIEWHHWSGSICWSSAQHSVKQRILMFCLKKKKGNWGSLSKCKGFVLNFWYSSSRKGQSHKANPEAWVLSLAPSISIIDRCYWLSQTSVLQGRGSKVTFHF